MDTSTTMLKRYVESGTSADFEALVRANGALVFGTALRSTRQRALAEEVTQEVFSSRSRARPRASANHTS